jgi:hypothetical protein
VRVAGNASVVPSQFLPEIVNCDAVAEIQLPRNGDRIDSGPSASQANMVSANSARSVSACASGLIAPPPHSPRAHGTQHVTLVVTPLRNAPIRIVVASHDDLSAVANKSLRCQSSLDCLNRAMAPLPD